MHNETMSSRERVVAALRHQVSDRVPIDLGSTWCSSTTIPFYEQLKKHFHCDAPTATMERIMQVSMIDEQILQQLHVDTRCVCPNAPELERNQEVELGEGLYRDPWGIEWTKPPTSHYYDLHKSPLGGEITLSDIMHHPWPEPYDPGYTRGLRERVAKMRTETDCALVLNLSLWPLQCSQNVRGYVDWYMDVVSAPHLIECMLDCITESMLGPIETVTAAIGDLVDAIAVSDDIGHQDRLCMSPKMYRKIVKPRHARLAQAIKSRSDKPLVWHTCGCVYDILDDLIEIGVDSLNPVQTTARNMEAERLKHEYGGRLSFWGAIDTMQVLNNGTPEDVRLEVRHKIAALAPGGGYILNPIHNVQPDVPVENLLAMIDAALEYGRFPIEAEAKSQG